MSEPDTNMYRSTKWRFSMAEDALNAEDTATAKEICGKLLSDPSLPPYFRGASNWIMAFVEDDDDIALSCIEDALVAVKEMEEELATAEGVELKAYDPVWRLRVGVKKLRETIHSQEYKDAVGKKDVEQGSVSSESRKTKSFEAKLTLGRNKASGGGVGIRCGDGS